MKHLLAVLVLGVPSLLAAPMPRDSEDVTFRELFGTAIDPTGWAKFQRDGTRLRISLDGNCLVSEDIRTAFSHVEREVTGEFTITTAIASPLHRPIPFDRRINAEFLGSRQRISGSVVLWLEEGHSIEIRRIYEEFSNDHTPPWSSRYLVDCWKGGHNQAEPLDTLEVEYDKPLHVRITRREMTYSIDLGTDGKTWKTIYALKEESPQTVRVMLGAWHDVSERSVIEFDSLTIGPPIPAQAVDSKLGR